MINYSIKACLIFIGCIIFSCSENDPKKIDPKAMEYNNQAMDLFFDAQFSSKKIANESFEKSLNLINIAIELDPHYTLAYINKAKTLSKLGLYKDAIESLNIVRDIDPNNIESITLQGFYYEKSGDMNKANENYKAAISAYNIAIEENEDNLNYITNRIFLLAFTEGKDKAYNEIKKVKEKHPNNSTVNILENKILRFERVEFIRGF